jgi:ADP-ribose pyrophosphatase
MEERTVDSRRVFDGHLISVRVDEVELADGRRTRREIVEHPGAVVIAAWDGERLATVRQWRHPAGAELLELPAGTLDPGETPLATAARELAEECGLAAGSWLEGPRFYSAPGFCTELLHSFVATDLVEAPSIADADEELETGWLTLPEALAAIDEGRVMDAKSIALIGWLARRLPMAPP